MSNVFHLEICENYVAAPNEAPYMRVDVLNGALRTPLQIKSKFPPGKYGIPVRHIHDLVTNFCGYKNMQLGNVYGQISQDFFVALYRAFDSSPPDALTARMYTEILDEGAPKIKPEREVKKNYVPPSRLLARQPSAPPLQPVVVATAAPAPPAPATKTTAAAATNARKRKFNFY